MKNDYKKIILLSLAIAGSAGIIDAQNIAAGGWHSLAICNDSTVKAFGENATGQLGNGNTSDQSLPVPVPGLSRIIAVSAGGDQLEAHSMALKRDGTVWAWGSNLYGGLGNGSTNNSMAPVQSLGLTNAIAISAGGWHSSALKSDGTVWVWGWNTDGQLGDGTTTDKTVPAQVAGLSNVTKIAAGTYHMLALKSDGTVWAWGDNISGQIGDNSTTDRKTPVQVQGLSGIVNIAAGRFFSMAVKNDGTVWTWGENKYGQIGDNTLIDRHTPVQVSGLSGISSAVAATGAFHCMAVKNDNTVWAWGRNTYGNLGENTVTDQHIPVQMIGLSNITGMAAGTNFSLLYKSDGTFWGCGRNASGQLGDGTLLERHTAVQSTSLCPVLLPVGIGEQKSSKIQMSVFPNPSGDGKFNINMAQVSANLNQDTNIQVAISNALGQVVLESSNDMVPGNENIILDLSAEESGVYFLTVRAHGQILSQKLIKN